MDPNATDTQPIGSPSRPVSGPAILGFLMVATGGALLLDRLGILPAAWRLSLWPILLIAYGVARLIQPRATGREGLFFVITGAWWFAGAAGWLSMAATWPVIVVALGVSLMFEAATAARSVSLDARNYVRSRHSGAGWLVPLILIGAVLAGDVDGRGVAFGDTSHGQFRSFAVMGKHAGSPSVSELTGGDMVVFMGSNAMDLRQMTIAPGTTATVNVVAMMGEGTIVVPAGWDVDIEAVPIMGNVINSSVQDADWARASGTEVAPPNGGPAPHLIVKGVIMMGRLRVRS